jgi:asparagine synthase (glutamine-hydrolysing)
MCGILALANMDISQERKNLALERMWKRGPDQGGQWENADDRIWLGHRRLSIVDLSDAGQQPMHSVDGRLSLVFNGEIYNYPSLRRELEAKGYHFVSHCDTEVFLHAYLEWGLGMLERLQGMFAFVLWDHHEQKLIAARDHLGIKPLFYTTVGQGLALGSDLNALKLFLPTKPTPNPTALSYLITLGFITEPNTIWQEIKRLPPGHYLTTINHGQPTIHRYWEPPRSIIKTSSFDPSAWENLFETVIQEHLLADTPIGLFLSGGLDSTAVAACLRQVKAPIEALTIGFPGSQRDESAIAALTANHLHLPHRIIPMDKPDPLELIREVMQAVDEPMGASGPLSKYKICEAAQEAGYKVVFGGDGGDEVFCGYPRFLNLNEPLSPTQAMLRPLLRLAVQHFGNNPKLVQYAAKGYARQNALTRHHWRMYPRFLPEEAQKLLLPTEHRFTDADMLAPYYKHYEPKLPLQRALQRIELMTYCADGELARVDKVSMAHSLEWRVPMLDRRIIEFGLSQPYQVQSREQSKPIIRQYLQSRVPNEILSMKKQGFSIDNMSQLNQRQVINLIQNGPWVQQGYWNKNWQTLINPEMPYALARLSTLLMLTLWAETQSL